MHIRLAMHGMTTAVMLMQLATGSAAVGGVTEFPEDLSGFNAAAGYPAHVIDFDSIAAGSNITGQYLTGAYFDAPGSPLIVVRDMDTYTPGGSSVHKLFATSGENVLSPGGEELGPGPDALLENDDLRMVFDPPTNAVGLDILEQSVNGGDFIAIRLFDADGSEIFSSVILTPEGAANPPGGSHFYGVVSDRWNVASMLIDESDDDNQNPDANIGYDTFVFNSGGACEIGTPGLKWTEESAAAPWDARGDQSVVTFRGKLFLLAGSSGPGSQRFNDVWSYTQQDGWELVTGNAQWAGRSDFGCIVHDGKIWILGGSGVNGSLFNDVWVSSNGFDWTEATNAAQWTGRAGHAVFSFAGDLWVMGGFDGSSKADIWRSSDGTNWTSATASAPWSGRAGSGAVVSQGRMWIMGGALSGGAAFNDVWSSSNGVSWVVETAAAPWPANNSMGAVASHGRIWILGGSTQSGNTNDVWSTTDGQSWSNETTMPIWPERFSHGIAVYDDRIWVLGGDSPISGSKVNDVWSAPLFADCNNNDMPDECEIAGGTSADCNTNGVPDECEADFDTDGLIDDCDADIDNDGVHNGLDVCDFTPASAITANRFILDSASSLFGTFAAITTTTVIATWPTIRALCSTLPVRRPARSNIRTGNPCEPGSNRLQFEPTGPQAGFARLRPARLRQLSGWIGATLADCLRAGVDHTLNTCNFWRGLGLRHSGR